MTADWEEVGPEMVDLGLTSGTLWAKTNIGAQTETDYGQYFQWASIEPLHVEGTTVNPAADWSLCPYTDSEGNPSKYTGSDYDTLQSSDDAATVILGVDYRMPTQAEFRELLEEINNEFVEDFNGSGISGYKFTNKSDSSKYIFLPAVGICINSKLNSVGLEASYWSSSLNTNDRGNACSLWFNNEEVNVDNGTHRCDGFAIRPVRSTQQ